MTPEELLAGLSSDRPYPADVVEEISSRWEELVPLLLGYLVRLLDEPAEDDLDSAAQLYILALLAHHREVRAHGTILRFVREASDVLDDFLGDAITEDLGYFLFATSGGQIEELQALFEDVAVHPWARVMAVHACTMVVADGAASREHVLDAYEALILADVGGDEPVLAAAAGDLRGMDSVRWTSLFEAQGDEATSWWTELERTSQRPDEAEPAARRLIAGAAARTMEERSWWSRDPVDHHELWRRLAESGLHQQLDGLKASVEAEPGRGAGKNSAERKKSKAKRKRAQKARRKNKKGR